MNINDASDAFNAAVAANTALDRDFKGEVTRAKTKIDDVKETVEAVGTAIEDAKKVLESGKEMLDSIYGYFAGVLEFLANNSLPTNAAQAIANLAEECQSLIMSPDAPSDSMVGRTGSVVSLLDEFVTHADEAIEASTTAFDKIEELAGMISAYATE